MIYDAAAALYDWIEAQLSLSPYNLVVVREPPDIDSDYGAATIRMSFHGPPVAYGKLMAPPWLIPRFEIAGGTTGEGILDCRLLKPMSLRGKYPWSAVLKDPSTANSSICSSLALTPQRKRNDAQPSSSHPFHHCTTGTKNGTEEQEILGNPNKYYLKQDE
ncbi:hypothetical protein GQ600_15736 [Phytophthora cactorum]|nr:hypothetical protein GQ600_15736 [Phytophthora cactorum]